MKSFLLAAIRLYQHTLSPDHGFFRGLFPGGFCKYRPSCSAYTYEAVRKYGIGKGLIKGFWRVLRCNPCGRGGWNLP